MTKIDNFKSSFKRKLDERSQQSETRLVSDLQTLSESLLHQAKPVLPKDVARRLEDFDAQIAQSKQRIEPLHKIPQALIDLHSSTPLRDLDAAFIEIFSLDSYYPTKPLEYPTIFCESLEEFFTTIVEQLNLSAEARQAELTRLSADAQRTANESGGGGIFGYNLPGLGCYLNGWLFVYGHDIPPRGAFQNPELLKGVLGTAAHEKLGHGFLSAYSALGRVKAELGISVHETARRFGVRSSDDPVDSLRQSQAQLLNMASQIVEEGWSTWVETFLASNLMGAGGHPRYSLEAIIKAIQNLSAEIPNHGEIQSVLLGSLQVIFAQEPEAVPLSVLHQAVMVIEMLGSELDEYFSNALSQPIRYAVGELIMAQAGVNLGPVCVPYAALIAANISFDPEEISLADLREMFASKPNLNPDARLAALSRLQLSQANSVSELAERAAGELSFSVPVELKA